MLKPLSQTIWEECISEKLCIKVFGKKHCVDINACIRIIFENSNYYIEIDAFGQRWRQNLTKGCWTFYEIGIARFKVCVNPKNSGARVVLVGCVGLAGIKKCWTLVAQDIDWFKSTDLTKEELKSLNIEKEISALSDISVFGSVSSDLTPEEVRILLDQE